ncbi:lysylphosphatidylglycerol synthase transmembrane domain-containing protein [Lentibacter sp. XHP0401]|uniref:lysylphosphatidylglycerol synthase transmembrane domain-containing protein n=1 Tax=Lentibacter sp. XHP0401 TaxID=2984334 RepID=UPI0021E6E8E3|nr:lysylphosphatidylglycerol synthase transmembrane domain-containing protein [Lentibacter sp. XHP0401]MCV2893043.1 flippase-like domain-containing protein [Lentibacter sp. XHP0401]
MTMSSDFPAKPIRTGPNRWRDYALLGGLFVLVLVGLASLAAATGWQETMDQLRKLSAFEVVILLALSLVNYLFRALRWHYFTRCLGIGTHLAQNIRHFLGGFAMSVTPGRVGELIRMRWIKRETGWSFERTAPLVLVDRASDLAAMALILAVALLFSGAMIRFAIPVTLLAFAGAVLVTRPTLLSASAGLFYRTTGLFPRLMARIRRAARSLKAFSSAGILILATALGLIGWLAEGYAFWLLLTWMDAEISFWLAVLIFVFSTLAGGLTGAPGGIGGAEAAMVGLLLLEGIPLEVALPATAVIRLTTLWFAILIGLGVFPYAEAKSNEKGAH